MSLTDAKPAEQFVALEPPPTAWLPLTAADVALEREDRTPEHEWPGSLFVFLAKLAAFGMGLGAVGAAITFLVMLLQGDWGPAGLAAMMAVGLGIGCILQGTLARHVSHFTRWGWYGAMAELACVTLAKVNAIVANPGDFGGPLFGIVIDLLWIGYFWNRRADFDIDLSI